jgi:translation elongation factor EF-4
MSQVQTVTTAPGQMYTRKNDDGTIGVSFQTTEGEVDVTMSRAQALALGALLVSDSASGILYAIEDAQNGHTLEPLRRTTLKD